MITVSSRFDSGAIEVREIRAAASAAEPHRLVLGVRKDDTADPACDFRQWFHFRVQGEAGARIAVEIANAGECTYPKGWVGYDVCASYDRSDWFRVPARFDNGTLAFEHVLERGSIYFAYFEPYSWERHLSLLGRADASPLARVAPLGATVDGRDLDLVTVGAPGAGKKVVWVIARQHPGEAMAEWYIEGMLERLLDPADALARTLLERAVFQVVPNMNPDGSVRGNLRANAAGANLNREWVDPSLERSPEVYRVRERMLATGVDAFVDVHGDEALPYVFIAGSEMLPEFGPAQRAEQDTFCGAFMAASPDFQVKHGYPSGKYAADLLKLASKWVGHRFGCLSVTLEMPFKDNANLPDPRHGWSATRSKRLGAASLDALFATVGR